MAVTFRFPSARPIDLVGFAWSPMFEAALSLRAVVQSKRTPMHLPWIRRCRELPDDLQSEMRLLFRPFDRFVPGFFEVALREHRATFAEELADLEALDPGLVAVELGMAYGGIPCEEVGDVDPALADDAGFRDRVRRASARDDDLAALADAALDDPDALRSRYVRLMERYWDEAFAAEWERVLPRIEADATAGARALVTAGLPALVRDLLPEGRWDEASTSVVVAKDWEGTCDVAQSGGLLFVPTVYGWPCVLIDLIDPWPTSIIFPLRDLRTPEVPHATDREVVTGLTALGDETRLQIARLVAEDPRSTKELAQLLSLSDSAVSRHLKILEAAGIVAGRRDGYFVLYRLVPERLDVIAGALRGTLGLVAAAPGDLPALPVAVHRTG